MISCKGLYEAIAVNDATQNYLQTEYFMSYFPSVMQDFAKVRRQLHSCTWF